jgi:hypothetical protein
MVISDHAAPHWNAWEIPPTIARLAASSGVSTANAVANFAVLMNSADCSDATSVTNAPKKIVR